MASIFADMSPIENVWDYIGRKVSVDAPLTTEELWKKQKKKTYTLNKKKEKTKDVIAMVSNKLRLDEKKTAVCVKNRENEDDVGNDERNKSIKMNQEVAKKNKRNYYATQNIYSKTLKTLPKITITAYYEKEGSYNDDTDSLSSICLDSNSEEDNDSDFDEYGDFKITCSADVTTDEEMSDDPESTA